MRRMSAARLIASWVLMVGTARATAAQGVWNDARSRALVERATQRRAEQLADTGLVDYRANARGYVTFLAALGDGFLETPKVIKTDQLALEVYWHAPNLSKQRIIGRRDTLLLPTDIQYHSDHLGIVQNNFPAFIRIGDGDEVADVPHPLSPAGLGLYDFQLSDDSIRIQLPGREIDLLEVKVRPKDDRAPRVIGAIFIDPTEGQVVRMAFNFTHAAFLDKQLEDLAVVLENRLVGTRYWLPSRQEIEIRRTGTWMDFPVRGIIRGRWEIGEYQFNLGLPAQTFVGPEIVSAPPSELKRYAWPGSIMDSLPPDVRATVDPDIQRVLAEARVLVRGQALARAQTLRPSARHLSEFARVNRVEGLALGGGFTAKLVSNFSVTGTARYGIDDRVGKWRGQLRWEQPTGSHVELFASRDYVDIGDQAERSSIINSLAAQEFGSDLTDPYEVRSIGVGGLFRKNGFDFGLTVAKERDRQLRVHATSQAGSYEPVPTITPLDGTRVSLIAYRPLGTWIGPGELRFRAGISALRRSQVNPTDGGLFGGRLSTRLSFDVENRSQIGAARLIISEQAIGTGNEGGDVMPLQEQVFFGGPLSAPGYPLHSLVGVHGSTTRIELQAPVPFIAIPLGRFGRVPGQARLAPYLNLALVDGLASCTSFGGPCMPPWAGYPSVGVGLLTVFDALRFDVARGLRHGGWVFNVDVSRDFWNIL